MEGILSKLDVYTKQWASNLTEDDIAKLLQAVYKLPGLLETLKFTPHPIINLNVDESTADTLSEKIEKSQKAADIGKAGEVKFADICQRLPANYHVQDTSKQGKKGDFIITYSDAGVTKRCMIDIKNYSSTVPKKEIDKFYEDLTFGSYDAGLIISYRSKFVGIADHVFVEETCLPCGKIPVMYLVTSDEELILQSIQLLIAKSVVHQSKDINIDRIESLIESINGALSNSSDVRRLLSELQVSIAKSIQKCQENLVTHEAHVKKSLREMGSCVSKVLINRILPHVPKINARDDNAEPSIAGSPHENLTPVVEEKSETRNSAYRPPLPRKASVKNIHPSQVQEVEEVEIIVDTSADQEAAMQKICKSDRAVFAELLSLAWDDIDYPLSGKVLCELTSTNLLLRINALKTKTSVTMDFLNEIEIPEADLTPLTHKITKDDSFICVLDDNLIEFIKKYMHFA